MTEFELAQALFRQQQAPDASAPTTSQVRGVAASDSSDGTVTVVLDATAGGASAEMEVPTTGGITEGSEVLVTLLDGAPVEVTQAGSIDGAAGSATKYITETGDYGIRVHPEGDTANYSLIDADGMDVVKGGTNVAHFGETARLGAEDGYHTEVTSEGMRVSDGTDDVVRIYSEVTQDGVRRGSVDIGKSGDDTLTSVGGSAEDYTEDDYVYRKRSAELIAMASTESDGARVEAWAEHASAWDEDNTGVTLRGKQLDLYGPNGEGYASVSMEDAGKVLSLVSTDWADLPLASGVRAYTAGGTPRYREVMGAIVVVSGTVTPLAQVAAGGSIDIGTLPEGFRPARDITMLCQGSGNAVWLLYVGANGVLTCSRYRDGSTNAAIGTSAWLTFHCTFAL